MFGTTVILNEQVVPNIPLSDEGQLAILIYEDALREVHGKEKLDCRSDQKARLIKKIFGSEEGREDSGEDFEESREIQESDYSQKSCFS